MIAVYQFGSTVGEIGEHIESDRDLAVLADRPLPNLRRWTLQESFSNFETALAAVEGDLSHHSSPRTFSKYMRN